MNLGSRENQESVVDGKMFMESEVKETKLKSSYGLNWKVFLEIFLHPFNNAIKFAQMNETVQVEIRVLAPTSSRVQSSTAHLTFETRISNFNCALRPESLEKMFLIFQDFGSNKPESLFNPVQRKCYASGIGLGLYTANQLSQASGGSMSASITEDKKLTLAFTVNVEHRRVDLETHAAGSQKPSAFEKVITTESESDASELTSYYNHSFQNQSMSAISLSDILMRGMGGFQR